MIRLNINEIKSNLSKYVEMVQDGETIVLCKRNLPVAEIRPVVERKRKKPVLGSAKGTFVIPPEFFDPLPEPLLAAFEGGAPGSKQE